jgi:hypothetical protein
LLLVQHDVSDAGGRALSESARRYPLSWPTGWKRTPAAERKRAEFGKTVERSYTERHYDGRPPETKTRKTKAPLSASDAALRLEAELDRLGAEDAKLSTNQKLRLDGTPRSDLAEPADVGAAVYFTLHQKPRCLACDKWTRVADNIAAIAQHIDALRRIDRYGVGSLDQAFAGYVALPPVGGTQGGDWRAEFGFRTGDLLTPEIVEARYRTLLKARHPDSGGSHDAIVRLNLARDAARAYFAPEAPR